jgi:DNA-binding response OmpR family regulator
MLRFADHFPPVAALARRVLVVEDDAPSRTALSRVLTMSGYDVLGASDLAKAATQLVWQPDFVLLDLMLPDGGGLDLLSRIRRRDDPTMVAILSAASDEMLAHALQFRPDAIFRKPIDVPALLAWLKNPTPLVVKPSIVAFQQKGAP